MFELPKPWERQPNEGSKAWAAFVAYRNLGEQRTIAKACEVLKRPAVYASSMAKFSTTWGWVSRCRDFDEHIAAEELKVWEKERHRMIRRHAQLGITLQLKAAEALKGTMATEIPANVATTMLKTGVDIERLARGEATSSTEFRAPEGYVLPKALTPEAAELMLDKLREGGELPGMVGDN